MNKEGSCASADGNRATGCVQDRSTCAGKPVSTSWSMNSWPKPSPCGTMEMRRIYRRFRSEPSATIPAPCQKLPMLKSNPPHISPRRRCRQCPNPRSGLNPDWWPCRQSLASRRWLLRPMKRRTLRRATGALRHGSANALANCAPSNAAPTSPPAAVQAHSPHRSPGVCRVDGPVVYSRCSGAVVPGDPYPPAERRVPCPQIARRSAYSAAPPASSASSPASSITGTFSSSAFSSFEPASSPATT